MINITHVLTENDSAALINLLGTLPTSSNVFPLLVMLTNTHKQQVELAAAATKAKAAKPVPKSKSPEVPTPKNTPKEK